MATFSLKSIKNIVLYCIIISKFKGLQKPLDIECQKKYSINTEVQKYKNTIQNINVRQISEDYDEEQCDIQA
jgi:hypothetical protein